jgi:predicted AAA+ superfamily ATPase
MFGLFKKDPVKQLQKEYKEKSQKAMEVQRSGDLRAYAVLVEELEAIEKKIAEHTK